MTEGERLVKLETQTEAILEQQTKLGEDFTKYIEKLDNLLPTFATKRELEEVKRRHSLQVWLVGTLSGIFGMLLTLLIQNYINK